MHITFDEDYMYAVVWEDTNKMVIEGEYAVADNKLTFLYYSLEDGSIDSTVGLYTFAIKDSLITFTVVGDDLRRRVYDLDKRWVKVKD